MRPNKASRSREYFSMFKELEDEYPAKKEGVSSLGCQFVADRLKKTEPSSSSICHSAPSQTNKWGSDEESSSDNDDEYSEMAKAVEAQLTKHKKEVEPSIRMKNDEVKASKPVMKPRSKAGKSRSQEKNMTSDDSSKTSMRVPIKVMEIDTPKGGRFQAPKLFEPMSSKSEISKTVSKDNTTSKPPANLASVLDGMFVSKKSFTDPVSGASTSKNADNESFCPVSSDIPDPCLPEFNAQQLYELSVTDVGSVYEVEKIFQERIAKEFPGKGKKYHSDMFRDTYFQLLAEKKSKENLKLELLKTRLMEKKKTVESQQRKTIMIENTNLPPKDSKDRSWMRTFYKNKKAVPCTSNFSKKPAEKTVTHPTGDQPSSSSSSKGCKKRAAEKEKEKEVEEKKKKMGPTPLMKKTIKQYNMLQKNFRK